MAVAPAILMRRLMQDKAQDVLKIVSHASGWLLVLKKVNAVDRFPERDSN
jgi:hypothetical protein